MNWSKQQQQQQDDDPHGIQKLLNILRTQQDGPVEQVGSASSIRLDHQVQNRTSLPSSSRTEKIESDPNRNSNADLFSLVQQNIKTTVPPTEAHEDLRYISFAQALPHLSKLSKDDKFLEQLLAIKTQQDEMEQSFADERKKVSANDLQQFDKMILQKWDSLYARQQEKLQQLGVPCFFATQDPGHVRKQQRVFDVLSGLLE